MSKHPKKPNPPTPKPPVSPKATDTKGKPPMPDPDIELATRKAEGRMILHNGRYVPGSTDES
jgi:hypothetical protein